MKRGKLLVAAASMGIPLLRGRGLDDSDRGDAEPVVVVSQAFVDRFLPDGDPIGVVLDIGYGGADDPTERRIVGVVGDVKIFGLDDSTRPIYYLSRGQAVFRNMSIIVHTSLPTAAAHELVRATIAAADPSLVPYEVRTLDELVSQTTASERLRLGLIASFAALAIVLSGIGIYGMLSFGVAQRRQEIGLRLAIGASPRNVLHLILRNGIALAGVGVIIGTLGAVLLGRAIAAQLYGVTPYDPVVLVAVAAGLLVVAAIACWAPARRATAVDPAATLRAG